MDSTIKKVYDIRLLGADAVLKNMQSVNSEFDRAKKLVQTLRTNAVKNANLIVEPEKIKAEKIALEEAERALLKATTAKKQADAEAKVVDAYNKSQATERKKQTGGIEAEAGSYNKLAAELKVAKAELKNIPIGTKGFDEAFVKVKSLQDKVNDFNRSLSKDGLLVGEYSSGIIQAFKKLGLNDLISNQIDQTKGKIKQLETEQEVLRNQYNQAKQSGVKAFNDIEQKLILNINETNQLKTALAGAEVQFKGIGNIGSQITSSLNNQFKNLKTNISGLLLGYVGFQQVGGFLSNSIKEFEQAETATARFSATLENLGRANELDPLKNKIEELASTFKYLDNDDLTEAAEKLVTYGKVSKNQIEELLPIIIDFAAKQRISIGEATDIIIKGLEGNSKGLIRYGLSLKEASTESERYGVIVNELGKKVKGTADTFQSTSTGELAVYKQQIRNLQEDIGAKLLPILTTLIKIVSAVAGAISAIPMPVFIGTLLIFTQGIIANTAAWIANTLAKARNIVLTTTANILMAVGNGILIAQAIAQNVLNAATLIYNGLLTKLTVILPGVARVLQFLGTVMKATPLGLLITGVTLLISAFKLFGTATVNAGNNLKQYSREQQYATETIRVANQELSKQRAEMALNVSVAKDLTISYETRKAAVDKIIAQAPEYFKNLNTENILTSEGKKLLDDYNNSLQRKAELQAAAGIQQREFDKLTNLQQKKQELEIYKKTGDLSGLSEELGKSVGKAIVIESFNKGFDPEDVPIEIRNKIANAFIEKYNEGLKEANKNVEAATNNYKSRLDENPPVTAPVIKRTKTIIEKELKDLEDKINEETAGTENLKKLLQKKKGLQNELKAFDLPEEKKPREIKPKTPEKQTEDAVKKIEERFEAEKAALEIAKLQKGKYNNQVVKDEETYLILLNQITQTYNDKKIELLQKQKVKEGKLIAEARLEKVKSQKETDQKLYELEAKRLEGSLELSKQAAKEELENVEASPLSTDIQKVAAKEKYYNTLLSLQVGFNEQMNALEKKYNQISVVDEQNRASAINEIKKETKNLDIEKANAELKSIQDSGEKDLAEFKASIAEARVTIEASEKFSKAAKVKKLKILEEEEAKGILAREVATLKIILDEKQKLYESGKISEAEYYKAKEAYYTKSAELNQKILANEKATLDAYDKGISGFIKSLNKFTKNDLSKIEIGDSGVSVGYVIAESYDIAKLAMSDYYDAERQRIEQSKQASLDRLELEKQQVLAQAQSAAERESIERQYANKKRQIEIEAGEKLKKQKRAEIYISLAAELANIAVQAAANPANAFTFGVAGTVQYAILAALAIARSALQLSTINRQQFASGGEVPTAGGEFKGRSHSNGGTSFTFKGNAFEAEAKELAIINKKSASDNKVYNVTGTTKQIASLLNEIGGGKRFATGAVLHKYANGGYLGSRIQPPVFASYYSSATTDATQSHDNAELKALIAATSNNVDTVNQTLKNLTVSVRTQDINESQKQLQKQSEIATL